MVRITAMELLLHWPQVPRNSCRPVGDLVPSIKAGLKLHITCRFPTMPSDSMIEVAVYCDDPCCAESACVRACTEHREVSFALKLHRAEFSLQS